MHHTLTIHESVTLYGDNWARDASQYKHFLILTSDEAHAHTIATHRQDPAEKGRSTANYYLLEI